MKRSLRGGAHLWIVMLYDRLVPALIAGTRAELETKGSYRLTRIHPELV